MNSFDRWYNREHQRIHREKNREAYNARMAEYMRGRRARLKALGLPDRDPDKHRETSKINMRKYRARKKAEKDNGSK